MNILKPMKSSILNSLCLCLFFPVLVTEVCAPFKPVSALITIKSAVVCRFQSELRRIISSSAGIRLIAMFTLDYSSVIDVSLVLTRGISGYI